MNWTLKNLRESGVIDSLDRQFALALGGPGAEDHLLCTLALLRRSLGLGHVAASLEGLCQQTYQTAKGPVEFFTPRPDELRRSLEKSGRLGTPGLYRPMILDQGLLYLQKYHRYQERLQVNLKARLEQPPLALDPITQGALEARFPKAGESWREQPLAVALALTQRFFLLTGGPGTGKTTTAFAILVLAQERALRTLGRPLKVALLAPTGKAAARLGQSVARQRAELEPILAKHLEVEAQTLHRFLGFDPRQPHQFFHHAGNLADRDLVLVDEASMIDLPLFVKLLEALPLGAQVILMGDPDQLAAVESGSVLKDLCQDQDSRKPTSALAPYLPKKVELGPPGPRLLDHRLRLEESHRFDPKAGIGRLAQAIRLGEEGAWGLLGEEGPLAQRSVKTPLELEAALKAWLLEGRHYERLLSTNDPAQALAALGQVQVLCALREGPFGVAGINPLVQRLVFGDQGWDNLSHRPILIGANEPDLELYNGDLGVILRSPKGRQGDQAWFEGPQGPRSVPLALLPPYEPAFALTVHKSQGSEYDQVALVLPPTSQEILSQELLYTALTRAKKSFLLLGERPVFEGALKVRSTRRSGLKDALWGEGAP